MTDFRRKIREEQYFETGIFKNIFKDTTKKYITASALLKAIEIAGKYRKK